MKKTKLLFLFIALANLSSYSQNQPPTTIDLIGTYYSEKSCIGFETDNLKVMEGCTDCILLELLPNETVNYFEFNNSRGKKNQKTLKWELTRKDDKSILIITGDNIKSVAYSPNGYFSFTIEKISGKYCLISNEENGLGQIGNKWISGNTNNTTNNGDEIKFLGVWKHSNDVWSDKVLTISKSGNNYKIKLEFCFTAHNGQTAGPYGRTEEFIANYDDKAGMLKSSNGDIGYDQNNKTVFWKGEEYRK
jgi:hypothetical protein